MGWIEVAISRTRISSSGGMSSRFIAVQVQTLVTVTWDAPNLDSRLKIPYVLSIVLCPYLIDQVISPLGAQKSVAIYINLKQRRGYF